MAIIKSISQSPRREIEDYAHGGFVLHAAIYGLSSVDMDAIPIPGTWSIRQIVLHLMDSDLIASDRMKRVIAEENPMLVGFDESAFAAHLFYTELDAATAVDIFQKNRTLMAEILRRLPAEAFTRSGTHSQRGRITLGELLTIYVRHLDHHLKFLKHKRQLIGKPL